MKFLQDLNLIQVRRFVFGVVIPVLVMILMALQFRQYNPDISWFNSLARYMSLFLMYETVWFLSWGVQHKDYERQEVADISWQSVPFTLLAAGMFFSILYIHGIGVNPACISVRCSMSEILHNSEIIAWIFSISLIRLIVPTWVYDNILGTRN